ncbi:hypothetical protein GQ53DRAFT_804166, partial [Thozetella sp. PMI_491]
MGLKSLWLLLSQCSRHSIDYRGNNALQLRQGVQADGIAALGQITPEHPSPVGLSRYNLATRVPAPRIDSNVKYPDLDSSFDPTSLKPKDDPIKRYEIPVIKFQAPAGTTRYLIDPIEIVGTLNDIKPKLPLLYDSPPSVYNILSERSAELFAQKRKSRWGKSINQWIAKHPIDTGLVVAEPRIKALGDWPESTTGSFINGKQKSYADFTVASLIGFTKGAGASDITEKVLAMHPVIGRLYDAVKLTQLRNERSQEKIATYQTPDSFSARL